MSRGPPTPQGHRPPPQSPPRCHGDPVPEDPYPPPRATEAAHTDADERIHDGGEGLQVLALGHGSAPRSRVCDGGGSSGGRDRPGVLQGAAEPGGGRGAVARMLGGARPAGTGGRWRHRRGGTAGAGGGVGMVSLHPRASPD